MKNFTRKWWENNIHTSFQYNRRMYANLSQVFNIWGRQSIQSQKGNTQCQLLFVCYRDIWLSDKKITNQILLLSIYFWYIIVVVIKFKTKPTGTRELRRKRSAANSVESIIQTRMELNWNILRYHYRSYQH